jgi:hypothetical protein
MRFVHLTRVSAERSILRGGIRGQKLRVPTGKDSFHLVERGIFAMPVVTSFWTTYQWLRELRHWHDERMVAVHFRIPDDELVLVGKYSGIHAPMTAAEAARWVTNTPEGAQVIIPRGIRRKELLRTVAMTQLVGWTGTPPSDPRWTCLCAACVPRGSRDLMRKVRGRVAGALLAARKAATPEERRAALQQLDIPLERAAGRIDPTPLLTHARSTDAATRRIVVHLLGHFKRSQVAKELVDLADDHEKDVRRAALEVLIRLAGPASTMRLLNAGSLHALAELPAVLAYGMPEKAGVTVLEALVTNPEPRIREAAVRAAREMLSDDDLPGELRLRLLRYEGSPCD